MARGRNISLTDEQVAWVKAHWATTSSADIAAHCDCSMQTIARMAKRWGLPDRRKNKQPWRKPGNPRCRKGPRQLTEQEVAWLRAHWLEYNTEQIALRLQCSIAQMRKLTKGLGLPDKRGGARVGAGKKSQARGGVAPEDVSQRYFAPVPTLASRELAKRGISAATVADAFTTLGEAYNIDCFVRPWQLSTGNRYYCGHVVFDDGAVSSGGDRIDWLAAAGNAIEIACNRIATLKKLTTS